MFYSQNTLDETVQSNSKQNRNNYNSNSSNKDVDDSDDEGEEVYRSEMLLIGSISGRQEIRLNMKLTENIDGPKVSLEIMLGAFTLFCTPRQFHMLLLLCDILINGETVSSASKANATSNDDNERVLKEKLREMHTREDEMKKKFPSYGAGSLKHQTWSGDDYECASEIISKGMQYFNTLKPVGNDSILSSNSSMSSSMQSSASQTTAPHSHRHRKAIERDQNADISHYSIRVAGIYLILLHDDILIVNEDDSCELPPLNEASVEKLRYKSQHFFNYASNFINTCSTSDLVKIGAIFNTACDNNHLR
jgi:autophagy-related protein 2